MSLTNIAMIGILLGFVFLVVGFLMEGPAVESEPTWNRKKPAYKKAKRRPVRSLARKAA